MVASPTPFLVFCGAVASPRRSTGLSRAAQGQVPYIHQPNRRRHTSLQRGGTEDPAFSPPLLHDTIEDTSTTRGELAALFGEEVASIVEECTDDIASKGPSASSSRSSTPRKVLQGKLVKLAAKIANLRDMVDMPPSMGPRAPGASTSTGPSGLHRLNSAARCAPRSAFDAATQESREHHQHPLSHGRGTG